MDCEELPLAAIRPNPYQPRGHFDEEALGALADSIREVGVLQPVLVRPVDDGYELIAGERRWRAASGPACRRSRRSCATTDDATSLEQALVENLHREDLNPLEEAAAYQQLIEDFGLTHEEVATRVGKSRAAITNTLRLFQLPPSIQQLVQRTGCSMGHARALLGTPDRAFQEQLARRVVQETSRSARSRRPSASRRPPEPERTSTADRARRSRLRPPGLLELEELLGDHLETRVKSRWAAQRGRS